MKKLIAFLLVAVGLIGSASAQTPTGDLTNGLVAYYGFNGNFNDTIGGNNFTSISSGVSFTNNQNGTLNSAAVFNAYTDSIQTLDDLNLSKGSPFTISIWAKPSSTALNWAGEQIGGNLIQLGKLNYNMDNYGGWLYMDFSTLANSGEFYVDGGYSLNYATNQYLNIFDRWHQFTYVYDQNISSSLLYIDGNQVPTLTAEANRTNSRNLSAAPITIGNYIYSDNGNTCGGYANTPFSDLAIWNTALSSNQVSQLYAQQSVPEPSTYALFGLGAIGMLMVMRRKKAA